MDKRIEERRFKYLLATLGTVFGFMYLGAITFFTIPQANVRFADTILGAIITIVIGTTYNYFFGTSSGSQHKTDLLDKVTPE